MDDLLGEFIETGKSRGYVLWDEIEKLLHSETGEAACLLDEILTATTIAGVEIREHEQDSSEEPVGFTLGLGDPDDPVTVYVREMNRVPRLTGDQEVELARLISTGGREAEVAKDQLVEANLTRVAAVAQQYGNHGVHVLDLIQEGNTALLHALDQFNYTRPYNFSTYATWWIRRAIKSKLPTQ